MILQQAFLNVLEGNSLLFLDADGEDDGFDLFVRVFGLLSVFVGFDFFLWLELWKIIESLSLDHGFIGVELELIVVGNSVNNLLDFTDSEFFDFVTVQEEGELDEMISEIIG